MTETLQAKEFRAIHEVLFDVLNVLEKIDEAESMEEVEEVLPDVVTEQYDDIDTNPIDVSATKVEHMDAVKALADDLKKTANQEDDEPVNNFFNKKASIDKI